MKNKWGFILHVRIFFHVVVIRSIVTVVVVVVFFFSRKSEISFDLNDFIILKWSDKIKLHLGQTLNKCNNAFNNIFLWNNFMSHCQN